MAHARELLEPYMPANGAENFISLRVTPDVKTQQQAFTLIEKDERIKEVISDKPGEKNFHVTELYGFDKKYHPRALEICREEPIYKDELTFDPPQKQNIREPGRAVIWSRVRSNGKLERLRQRLMAEIPFDDGRPKDEFKPHVSLIFIYLSEKENEEDRVHKEALKKAATDAAATAATAAGTPSTAPIVFDQTTMWIAAFAIDPMVTLNLERRKWRQFIRDGLAREDRDKLFTEFVAYVTNLDEKGSIDLSKVLNSKTVVYIRSNKQ